MPISVTTNVNFGGGLNAVAAPHLLAENEVQGANNVDFSLENGAATCRRGEILLNRATINSSTSHFDVIVRNYNGTASTIDTSPWYYVSQDGPFYRAFLNTNTFTQTQIGSGASTSNQSFATSYQNYTYLANGSQAYRDNGTVTYEWVISNPTSAPTSITVAGGTFVPFNGTYTAEFGTVVGAGGSPWVLSTLTTGIGTTGVQVIADIAGGSQNWENPQVQTNTTSGNGTHTGTYTTTVGPYGVDYLLIGFSDKSVVTRVSRDVSVGDASFNNYWHAETDLSDLASVDIDPIAQMLNFTAQSEAGQVSRPKLLKKPIVKLGPSPIPAGYTSLVTGIQAWPVNRTDYQFVSGANPVGGLTAAQPTWTNCQKVRITIETTDTCSAVVGGWQCWGDQTHCLNDSTIGYSYCYTLARQENGLTVAEGGPSPFTTPVKVQAGQSTLLIGPLAGTYITNQGVTHYGLYRQGGVLNDAYLIDYFAVNNQGSSSAGIYGDGGYPDVEIVNNQALTRNLWGTWSGVNAVSEPWQDRIFLGSNNQLFWTAPGTPVSVQNTSQTTVSVSGDPIQGFAVWGNLQIINQNSVYEMQGSVFEGSQTDWTLQRTGARRGSVAPKTIVKTPYGIFLLGYDGASLYYPGYGVDSPLDWLWEKIGDAWKGTSGTDPASEKGFRCDPFNIPFLHNACAAYMDGKIYLAAATGASTINNTVYVIDLVYKRVWEYFYGFSITSLFWDFVNNRMVAGTTGGGLVQLEVGLQDQAINTSGSFAGPNWGVRTRTWSSPTNIFIEGASIEADAMNTLTARVLLGSVGFNMGTWTNDIRSWQPLPAAGAQGDNVYFAWNGSQGSSNRQAVSGLQWSGVNTPAPVFYWRSDFDEAGADQEKIWDCNFTQIEINGTGSVVAVTFVDEAAVMTNTIVGPTSAIYSYQNLVGSSTGPVLVPRAFPNETYGNISYTTYTSSDLHTTFQIYKTYNHVRKEPPRVLRYVTDHLAPPSETYVKTWLSEVNPLGGVILATLMLDDVVYQTATFTGSARKTYEIGTPNVSKAKTVRVVYNAQDGVPFKWYSTDYEFSPQPYSKKTWLLTYTRPGGVTQMDMARFNALDVETQVGTATITSTWIADSIAVLTNTLTVSGRKYFDVLSFPPGIRGYLFQQQMTSDQDFQVWRSNLDIERIGVKGFSRITYRGKPVE